MPPSADSRRARSGGVDGAGRVPYVACLDVGSTWTKLAVVDVEDGTLVATGAHPTTAGSDVLHGVDALLADAGPVRAVYCCSSAGGGLRLAVVGYQALVSAQAAHRVALTAGARVVHIATGTLTTAGVAALRQSRPDVILLVGGTDGGDTDVLLHNAHRLGTARTRTPVVLAGNVDARDAAVTALTARGVPVVTAGNVLPRIGVLDPGPARAAIRDVFLRHVIGGKKLSHGPRFPRMVSAATPDAVLTAVDLLAEHTRTGLLIVDVGGATTDVYSALVPATSETAVTGDVAGTLWRARTVEGDLGVNTSADSTRTAAAQEKLAIPEPDPSGAGSGPGADPGSGGGEVDALGLASVAATVAVRRHARSGRDLRDTRLVVASGGVFRHADPGAALAAVRAVLHDDAGGWALPREPRVVVDARYVLAPAGLIARDHPGAALALLRRHLLGG